ncbi:hypothetical protein PENSPDRAFT_737034 [Peniophora sp. CONT]|nr:hypothetical protein PENSPDRAFT_737034 [Peniophora sp. CONT]
MTQLILYAGAQPSVWGRFRTHGLATIRATIWTVSLFAQWFLYATLLNSVWRLACTCMKLSAYPASLFSMLVGTDGLASTPTSTAPAAATTTLDAILTLVRRTATGHVDPVMLFDGKLTPLFAASLDFSTGNLVDRASALGPALSLGTVLGGVAKGCLMIAGIFVISTVVKSLRAAVEALGAEKKRAADITDIAAAFIHLEAHEPDVDAAVQSASDECISESTSGAIDSDSEQELSGVTLAPPCTPSGSLSDLKSAAMVVIQDEKLGVSQAPSPDSQIKTQAAPALNPTAPVFKPRAPPMLKRRPAVLNFSQPTTPATDSAASTPGPLTPTTPSPAPAPIPTHFTRRPPVTPRRSGPILGDVKPRTRVFAPVVRGPDGLVRVLPPGGRPLVVEPTTMAADMFY